MSSSPTPPATIASAQDFDTALKEDDFHAVQRIAADAHQSRSERNLAQAALAYWLRQNQRAEAELSRAANDAALPESLRRRASLMLSGLRLQQSRYAEAAGQSYAFDLEQRCTQLAPPST